MLSSTVISAIILALAPSIAARSGGYAASCTGVHLETESGVGVFLQGMCNFPGGGSKATQIKLGSCLGNNNGQIVYQVNGAYGVSCQSSTLSGTTLKAYCKNDVGNFEIATIDLNTVVGNSDGNMVC